jgi:hypothetical protein
MDERYIAPRLPASQIRDERLKLVTDVLALTLRDVATLPVPQQKQVCLAMKALTDVQQWCRAHAHNPLT